MLYTKNKTLYYLLFTEYGAHLLYFCSFFDLQLLFMYLGCLIRITTKLKVYVIKLDAICICLRNSKFAKDCFILLPAFKMGLFHCIYYQ